MSDMLLVQVTLGTVPSATALKPFAMKRATFGM